MRNSVTRIGGVFFVIYLMFYSGFVLLAAFFPESMEALPLAGVNVAIWYGFGLIILAFVLAMAYGWARRAVAPDDRSNREAPGGRS